MMSSCPSPSTFSLPGPVCLLSFLVFLTSLQEGAHELPGQQLPELQLCASEAVSSTPGFCPRGLETCFPRFVGSGPPAGEAARLLRASPDFRARLVQMASWGGRAHQGPSVTLCGLLRVTASPILMSSVCGSILRPDHVGQEVPLGPFGRLPQPGLGCPFPRARKQA